MRHARQHPAQIAQVDTSLRRRARHRETRQVQIGGGHDGGLLARQVNLQIQWCRSQPRCIGLRARGHLGDRFRQAVVKHPLLGGLCRYRRFGLGACTGTLSSLASPLFGCSLQRGLALTLGNGGGGGLLGGNAFSGCLCRSGLKFKQALSRQTLTLSLNGLLGCLPTRSLHSGCGLQQGLPLFRCDGGCFRSLFSGNALTLGSEAIPFGSRCGLAFGLCQQALLLGKP